MTTPTPRWWFDRALRAAESIASSADAAPGDLLPGTLDIMAACWLYGVITGRGRDDLLASVDLDDVHKAADALLSVAGETL